jgi:hypothetical protein
VSIKKDLPMTLILFRDERRICRAVPSGDGLCPNSLCTEIVAAAGRGFMCASKHDT